MKKIINEMKLRLPAKSINESLVRAVVSAFSAELNPTVEELGDLRCAVSEAVTNAIVHGYRDTPDSMTAYIYISCRLYDTRELTVEISDNGCGIRDVEEALRAGFTTGDREERSGIGFLVMRSFTDSLSVKSKLGRGTRVLMKKKLSP